MKYMLIMRSSGEAAPAGDASSYEDSIETMSRYNEELVAAGVLVAMEGLSDDPAESVVVDYAQTPPVATDGPYGEAKELFGGYWILDVGSQAEAVEWAKRAPLTFPAAKVEIRRIASIDEFPQDNPWIQRERAWREATGQL
ncbi:YciI family protein [Cellulomonas sp. Y8]|uniref:YciI family protein n=1 Tax=Cellulomonas sp. Y8 TaxID=2591145 RepID=UPI003D707B48